jgi:hypothetical protein
MRQHTLKLLALLAVVLAFLLTFGLVNHTYGHETHGFTHLLENTGSMVGSTYCREDYIHINWMDPDEDGTIDGCSVMIVSHDRFHIRHLPVYDSKTKPCKCEDL